jgi:hypothetical protein
MVGWLATVGRAASKRKLASQSTGVLGRGFVAEVVPRPRLSATMDVEMQSAVPRRPVGSAESTRLVVVFIFIELLLR